MMLCDLHQPLLASTLQADNPENVFRSFQTMIINYAVHVRKLCNITRPSIKSLAFGCAMILRQFIDDEVFSKYC